MNCLLIVKSFFRKDLTRLFAKGRKNGNFAGKFKTVSQTTSVFFRYNNTWYALCNRKQKMNRIVFINLLFFMSAINLKGQDTILFSAGPIPMYGIISGSDTVFMSTISEVFVTPWKKSRSEQRDMRKYRKLVYNVKKVYPYAKIAGRKFMEIEAAMDTLKTNKQQRDYINKMEAEIKGRYEEELKNLTITQGRILIKLIDRETGHTSYDMVRQLQGNVKAFMWQTLARLFGSNLKMTFDEAGEDKLINDIVIMVEQGLL